MGIEVGETVIDYALLRDLIEAHEAGVFADMGVPGVTENRHVSELEYRMSALDDKETYIAVKTLVMNRWETFKKTLEYLERKEGEKKNA